jgi:hypothetical protein
LLEEYYKYDDKPKEEVKEIIKPKIKSKGDD